MRYHNQMSFISTEWVLTKVGGHRQILAKKNSE